MVFYKRGCQASKLGGDTTRTRSEFKNELNENKVQFARIRDKNVNFILCQFQRFALYFSGGSRIFPRGLHQLPKVLLFSKFLAKKCMKMIEFGHPEGGGASLAPPLDPPTYLQKEFFEFLF